MKQFVYILGPPGAGKTTAMRGVCAGGMKIFDAQKPVKHVGYMKQGKAFAVLGEERPPFGGTDTLSYTVINGCDRWLAKLPDIVFAEGDRLATARIFASVRKQYSLSVVYLNCPDALLKARRAVRAKEFGLPMQDDGCVAGRLTKHRGLAEREGAIFLDATADPKEVAEFIWVLAGE